MLATCGAPWWAACTVGPTHACMRPKITVLVRVSAESLRRTSSSSHRTATRYSMMLKLIAPAAPGRAVLPCTGRRQQQQQQRLRLESVVGLSTSRKVTCGAKGFGSDTGKYRPFKHTACVLGGLISFRLYDQRSVVGSSCGPVCCRGERWEQGRGEGWEQVGLFLWLRQEVQCAPS